MTKDEALKMALDALKMCRGVIRNNIENLVPIESPNPWFSQDVDRAITAIREALAQPEPEQEPVVWMYQDKISHAVKFQRHMSDFVDHSRFYETPLYTTPPQRKPLTDEEIEKIWWETKPYFDKHDFTRAIEAAHGIKE